MSIPSEKEVLQLRQDKYGGDASVDITKDIQRLSAGEPLAYVIGWMPFLGLRVRLDSHPLIPRPETEDWTEALVAHLKERFGNTPFRVLDLCAGSGAGGLAVLASCPQAKVSFGELMPAHEKTIRLSIEENGLDAGRADIRTGDLFKPFSGERFAVVLANPPYIPEARSLDASVVEHEPSEALFSGPDGLTLIRRIAQEVPEYLSRPGELWMECDIENIEEAQVLLQKQGAKTNIRNDQYGRPRVCVGYWA